MGMAKELRAMVGKGLPTYFDFPSKNQPGIQYLAGLNNVQIPSLMYQQCLACHSG
jgi:hypothetical protein